MSMEEVSWRVSELENSVKVTQEDTRKKHESSEFALKNLKATITDLTEQVRRLERRQGGANDSSPNDVKRIEWKIPNIKEKMLKYTKGESLWSPEFGATGINGIQLEFFPNGRESTTITGFCSLFLWCPSGTKIKYQLSVGSHLRAPDEDTYDGRMGHGHSNFCNLEAEMDPDSAGDTSSSVTVAVDILDVERAQTVGDSSNGVLKVITGFSRWQVKKEAELLQNRSIEKVEWKLSDISKKLKNLPRGSSIYSELFSAAGIKEILLEFYPNGSQNTTKDGYCAFYIRCPEGTNIIVTLFVGSYRKGPISATFDGSAGKGLPDFCELEKEIRMQDDSVIVGLQIQNPSLEDGERRAVLQLTG
eukprot:GEMP01011679.1.p1 GENE.GEMP01011679.1~~GEMP01011679.1.p1  ORF type:complete len:361 (+),score=85.66 GEMP01011679.1:88-1170(+)